MRFFRLSALVIVMMIGLSLVAPRGAYGSFSFQQRKVRVGIGSFSHFSEKLEDGRYGGILVDYLTEIKKYTGWDIEYVEADPIRAIEMLDTGAIDLMGGMIKNSQTQALYDFAELNSGYAYSTIITHKNRTEYRANDYDTFNTLRVGVYNKAVSRVEAFERFRRANGLDIIPVYFDDANQWEEAFRRGEVDAQLTSSAKLREGEKIIASFQVEPYYFGVAKGNTHILRELNHALELIYQLNPSFDASLYRKYFSESGAEEWTLTSAEKKFVTEHPVLRVTAAPDWQPISSFDSKGQLVGISADILQSISEKTGFKMEYLPATSFKQALNFLQTNQADLMVGALSRSLVKESHDLSFSLPYLPMQMVMLQKNEEYLGAQRKPVMAVVCGLEYDVLDNCVKQRYDGTRAAIDAVATGKVDFTVVSNLVAENYMMNHGKCGMNLVPISNGDAKLSLAFLNPVDPVLLTIFDKAIYTIDDAQRQAIIFQNTANRGRITLANLIYSNPTQAMMMIVLVGSLVLLLIFLMMNMRLRLSRKNALLADTYRIIGEISDEHIFAYDFETSQLSLPESFTRLTGFKPLLSPEDCEKVGFGRLLDSFRKNTVVSNFALDFPCRLADGSQEMFRASCAISRDAGGRPIRGIGKLVSVQAEIEEKQRLEKMVNTDSLTGLFSKRYCEQRSMEAIEWGQAAHQGALMLIDIDNFKAANDVLGHLGGDEVLKHFARILRTVFHSGEVLGRWGGDEFLVFMRGIEDQEIVEKKAQRLCTNMNDEFIYKNATIRLSVSVGIAFADGSQDFREVFQAADQALYQVKRDKKNGYKFA